MLNQVIDIAREAGKAILDIYETDFEAYEKQDQSPLTEADLAAHKVIVAGLKELTPDIPVLSEESVNIPWEERQKWETYWLVDPLDGTKEFIKKNGEFTVNIALITNHKAVLGVVYAPVLERCYFADDNGAYVQEKEQDATRLHVSEYQEGNPWRVVASRSHMSDETRDFVEKLGEAELVSMGSSLKLCLVAEGKADVYPRFGLTSEWDTAAAQCVVEQANGSVITPELEPLLYNTKDSLLNSFFIVCGGTVNTIRAAISKG